MRTLAFLLLLVLAAFTACKGGTVPSAPTDPKSLYRMEAFADPATSGSASTLHIAIRPVEGAEVKPETPFRAKLEARGPIALGKTEFGYADHVRVENQGPIFEIPFEAKEAGKGEIDADMTFFVCMAEACLRTTEKLTVPVVVQ